MLFRSLLLVIVVLLRPTKLAEPWYVCLATKELDPIVVEVGLVEELPKLKATAVAAQKARISAILWVGTIAMVLQYVSLPFK